ncbi:hypothetical protein, partial [Rhabdaerophilum sp.]|uniref:hypothetical protein n=1 Tax=Rhabdaerophilum sp. TaxID=2717341 RepID=UPI0038D45359
MSAKLDFLKRKLSKTLSRAAPADFFAMIWSVRAIQSGETAAAGFFENFPPEALDQRIDNSSAIHPWELESLTNLYLQSKPNLDRTGKYTIANCQNFETIRCLINIIRDIENEQYAKTANKSHIFFEMTRIGYRQFAWQRTYVNTFQFYRNRFIYDDIEIQNIFYKTYGLELKSFFLLGFYLYSLFRSTLYVPQNFNFESKEISDHIKNKTLQIIATALDAAKLDARKSAARSTQTLGHDYIAYRESTLRRRPVLQLGHFRDQLSCPIPDFLVLRITEGIYYDLVSLDNYRSKITNIIGLRFEKYAKTIFEKWTENCTTHQNNPISIRDRRYAGVDLICKTQKY